MNVKQITIAFLNAGGFDGLCAEQCGCSLDDFMQCGDCMGSADEIKSGLHSCYRPAKIEANEEETHL